MRWGLALVLVIGATLLIRTFLKLQAVDPGFDTHNVLTMAMSISGDRFQKTVGVAQVIRDGTERLKAVPGCCERRGGVLSAAGGWVWRCPLMLWDGRRAMSAPLAPEATTRCLGVTSIR